MYFPRRNYRLKVNNFYPACMLSFEKTGIRDINKIFNFACAMYETAYTPIENCSA